MSKVKIVLRWALVILVLIAALGFAAWRMLRPTASAISPIEGNPEVPARPPEAVRLEKMFNKLLQEQKEMPNAPPPTMSNEE